MDFKERIIKIIELPRKFYSMRNTSIYALLKDTGYFQMYDKLTENDITNELNKFPDLINDWLTWSENKRIDSGWSFRKNKDIYVVEYFSSDKMTNSETYSNAITACAAFIRHEIEDIRMS